MPVPITNYVNVNISLENSPVPSASFGSLLFVTETTVGGTGDRVIGPFTRMSEITDYGFTSTDNAYQCASIAFGQGVGTNLYFGRRLAGDASLTAALDAIEEENGAAFYGVVNENTDDAENLELAAWCQSRLKLGMVQTSANSLLNGVGRSYTVTVGGVATNGDYEIDFTGFGLGAPVTVSITRAGGVPATNANLATALAAELELQTDVGGDIEGVLDSVSVNGAVITIIVSRSVAVGTLSISAPAPGTLTVATIDDDIARQLFTEQYTRCAIVYHADDDEYLHVAWMTKGLSFDLDDKKGIWGFLALYGVASDDIRGSQAAAIRSMNGNYYAAIVPSSGVETQAYTAQGFLPFGTANAGRRIDVTVSLDWLRVRAEEALLNVLVRSVYGVPYDDSGINQFTTAIRGVYSRGLAAGHLVSFIVPEGSPHAGRETPFVDAPLFRDTTATQRANRSITLSGLAYLRSAIEAVTFNLEIRQ